ncbi:beta strand repeat-containing protein [Bradyrhizobium genosp. A]|uniref:beta strand repeat-containing protein n=1 Tax=Bradyrhizobium genosp. A TaxID=83626 RepID=UPI003CF07A7D
MAGGAGGNATGGSNAGGGGGGGGAAGFSGAALPGANSTGTAGGAGGNGDGTGNGGGGGGGGVGAIVTGSGNLGTLSFTSTGAAGGAGGIVAVGGNGGDGGAGIVFTNAAGATFTVNAAVTGGAGGAGGAAGGVAGAGGVGIVGQNLTIAMGAAGTVSGGSGANALTLSGTNALTLNSGLSGGVLGNIGVVTGGSLDFAQATNATFAHNIAGTGITVSKSGAGILTVSGANTYSGTTTVNGGHLTAGAANTFSASSAVVLANTAGVALDLAGFNQTIGSLAGGGTTGGNVTLGAGTLTTGGDNTSTAYAGVISGTGGLTKQGTGTMTVSGANTYSGTTTVNGGHLTAGAANTFSASSAVVLANTAGVALDLAGFNQTIGSLAGGGTTGGNVTLGAGTLTTGGDDTSTAYAGVISGTGGLTKQGTGTMTVSGANTYSGTTTVSGGHLTAGAANTFSASSAVVLANTAGVALDLAGFNQTIGSLAGGGTTGGNVTLGAGTLTTGGDNTSTAYAGVISGTGGLTKQGTGTMTVSGANTYSGTTTVNGGHLTAGAANTFSASSAVVLANTAGVALDLAGFNQTIGSLAGGGTTGGNVTLGAGTLTTGGDNTSTAYAGVISGTGGLTKQGTGTMTVSGANTYSGTTTVNGGHLTAGAANTFSASSAVVLANTAGVALDLAGFNQTIGSLAGGGTTGGNVTLGAGTLTTGGDDTSTAYAGVISGTGGLTKQGTGTMVLTNNGNNYSGGTNLNAGTIQVQANNALGTGTLAMANGTTLQSGAAGLTIANAVTLTGTDTFDSNGNTMTLSGTISGTGSLIKVNAGTIALSGNVTYTGSTSVNQGTLHVTGPYTNVLGAVLTVNNGGTYQIDQLLTNAGSIQVNAGGTLTAQPGGLTNQASGVIVNNGTVNDALNNAGLVTNNSVYNADVASNTGTINNNGAWNTLATGFTNSAGGVVNVTGGSVMNATAGGFSNAGTLNATGTSTLTGALVNNGTINLSGGSGSSNINATTSAYSGNGTINAGTVNLTTGAANQVRVASTSGSVVLNGTATGGGFTGFIPVVNSSGGGSITASGSTITSGLFQAQVATSGGSAGYNTGAVAAPAAAPLTSILSTLSAIDASFHQPGGNLVASPQTDKPCTSFTPMTGNDKTCQVVGGPWARVSSGVTTVSSVGTERVNGVIFDQVSSKQRVQFTGVQAGADSGWLNLGGSGVNAHFGITGGQVEATADEQVSTVNTVNFNVPFMGLYYLVTRGAFSTDFTYRHSWYDMGVTNPVAQLNNSHFHGQSDNVNGSISYTFALPKNFFIEPTANLSYTRSTFDNLSVANGLGFLGFNELKSLLGRAGVRVGTGFSYGGFNWSPFGIALVQHEFAGDAGGTFTGAGTGSSAANITTTRVGTFYQTSLGLSFQSQTNGLLGFVRADYRFGDNLHGGGILGGVRYTFGP